MDSIKPNLYFVLPFLPVMMFIFVFGFNHGYGQSDDEPIPIKELTVKVEDEPLELENSPKIKEGRILLPARPVFESLGAEMEWDGKNKVAYGIKGDHRVSMPIGYDEAIVNGERKSLDVRTTIINDRTYVPFRFAGEALGAQVLYEAEDGVVNVNLPESDAPEEKPAGEHDTEHDIVDENQPHEHEEGIEQENDIDSRGEAREERMDFPPEPPALPPLPGFPQLGDDDDTDVGEESPIEGPEPPEPPQTP